MLKVGVFVALLVAMATAAPKPCCGPAQYMAGVGATVGQVDPAEGGTAAFYTLMLGAWDFTNRQFGYNLTVAYLNNTSTEVRIIQKYAQGSQWIILDNIQYCSKMPAQKPEPFNCVPDNATYSNSLYIGKDGLWIDNWYYGYSHPEYPIDGVLSFSVEQKTCYPAGSNFIGTRYGNNNEKSVPMLSQSGVFNVTLGIPDPDRFFALPSYCETENLAREERSIPNIDFFSLPRFF